MNAVILGVDLGGTNLKSALVDQNGRVLERLNRSTDADSGPDAVVSEIAECIANLRAWASKDSLDVMAVGVGAPGPMDWRTGVVFSPPNLKGWKDVPLAATIAERTGIPTFVDNDANVACWGEFWAGAGREVQSLCCITLGTGVGGGIVVNGELLRGPDGTAGEIGHLCVQRDGRQCGCGARGCLEAYASVTGLVCTAREGLEAGQSSTLTKSCGGDYAKLTGKMISDAAAAGDAFARGVIEETARWIGVGVGSLINLLNPEMVVLCGGMIGAGDLLFDTVRKTAADQAFAVPVARARIVPAALGQDAGVIGAAGCAFKRIRLEQVAQPSQVAD